MAPKVSIGLPVYNGENYLAEALDSILAQTFTDFELIIGDNASTDRTELICREYQARDPRIRYVRQPENLGACRNYDMTFELSRGEYFKWAAHDDNLAPEFLAVLVAVLDADPGCVLTYSTTVRINARGEVIGKHVNPAPSDSPIPAERLRARLIPNQLCFPVFGLCRRSVMARTPLHGDYLGSDRVFMAAMLLEGRWSAVSDELFFNRKHPEQSVSPVWRVDRQLSWYRGRRTTLPVFRKWRLLWGYLRAIHRSSLTFSQRWAAYRVMPGWIWLQRLPLTRELLLPLYYNEEKTALMRVLSVGWQHLRRGIGPFGTGFRKARNRIRRKLVKAWRALV